jgi:hypothetical protein
VSGRVKPNCDTFAGSTLHSLWPLSVFATSIPLFGNSKPHKMSDFAVWKIPNLTKCQVCYLETSETSQSVRFIPLSYDERRVTSTNARNLIVEFDQQYLYLVLVQQLHQCDTRVGAMAHPRKLRQASARFHAMRIDRRGGGPGLGTTMNS